MRMPRWVLTPPVSLMLRKHRRALLVVALIIAIGVTVGFILAPLVVGVLGFVGGLMTPVVVFAATNWELTQRWIGRGLSLLGWASGTIDRTSTAAQVQGVINGGREVLQDELDGIMSEPARVRFVKDAADLARVEDGEIVIAMKRSRDAAENLANATLAYVTAATIRPARPYVDPDTLRSIDFSLTKRVLYSTDKRALDYLLTRLWPPAVDHRPDLLELCHLTEALGEDGLLTRVLLAEYLDMGRRLYGRFPPPRVYEETREFAQFLYRIAAREPGVEPNLSFRSANIRVGVVLVGDRDRAQLLGAAPYIRAVLINMQQGASGVYMLARGARRPILIRAVEQLGTDGRVMEAAVTDYVVSLNGRLVDASCARILFHPGAASAFGLTSSGRPSWRRGARAQRRGQRSSR